MYRIDIDPDSATIYYPLRDSIVLPLQIKDSSDKSYPLLTETGEPFFRVEMWIKHHPFAMDSLIFITSDTEDIYVLPDGEIYIEHNLTPEEKRKFVTENLYYNISLIDINGAKETIAEGKWINKVLK